MSGPLPSIGLAERVDDPAEQAVADRHREDAAGGRDRWPSSMWRHLAEHDRADRLLVEVERQAEGAVLELEQLVDRRVGQARHAGDAVAHLDDPADLGLGSVGLEARQALLEGGGDVVVLIVSSAMSIAFLGRARSSRLVVSVARASAAGSA